jgi:hypothetical protein
MSEPSTILDETELAESELFFDDDDATTETELTDTHSVVSALSSTSLTSLKTSSIGEDPASKPAHLPALIAATLAKRVILRALAPSNGAPPPSLPLPLTAQNLRRASMGGREVDYNDRAAGGGIQHLKATLAATQAGTHTGTHSSDDGGGAGITNDDAMSSSPPPRGHRASPERLPWASPDMRMAAFLTKKGALDTANATLQHALAALNFAKDDLHTCEAAEARAKRNLIDAMDRESSAATTYVFFGVPFQGFPTLYYGCCKQRSQETVTHDHPH